MFLSPPHFCMELCSVPTCCVPLTVNSWIRRIHCIMMFLGCFLPYPKISLMRKIQFFSIETCTSIGCVKHAVLCFGVAVVVMHCTEAQRGSRSCVRWIVPWIPLFLLGGSFRNISLLVLIAIVLVAAWPYPEEIFLFPGCRHDQSGDLLILTVTFCWQFKHFIEVETVVLTTKLQLIIDN